MGIKHTYNSPQQSFHSTPFRLRRPYTQDDCVDRMSQLPFFRQICFARNFLRFLISIISISFTHHMHVFLEFTRTHSVNVGFTLSLVQYLSRVICSQSKCSMGVKVCGVKLTSLWAEEWGAEAAPTAPSIIYRHYHLRLLGKLKEHSCGLRT